MRATHIFLLCVLCASAVNYLINLAHLYTELVLRILRKCRDLRLLPSVAMTAFGRGFA